MLFVTVTRPSGLATQPLERPVPSVAVRTPRSSSCLFGHPASGQFRASRSPATWRLSRELLRSPATSEPRMAGRPAAPCASRRRRDRCSGTRPRDRCARRRRRSVNEKTAWNGVGRNGTPNGTSGRSRSARRLGAASSTESRAARSQREQSASHDTALPVAIDPALGTQTAPSIDELLVVESNPARLTDFSVTSAEPLLPAQRRDLDRLPDDHRRHRLRAPRGECRASGRSAS